MQARDATCTSTRTASWRSEAANSGYAGRRPRPGVMRGRLLTRNERGAVRVQPVERERREGEGRRGDREAGAPPAAGSARSPGRRSEEAESEAAERTVASSGSPQRLRESRPSPHKDATKARRVGMGRRGMSRPIDYREDHMASVRFYAQLALGAFLLLASASTSTTGPTTQPRRHGSSAPSRLGRRSPSRRRRSRASIPFPPASGTFPPSRRTAATSPSAPATRWSPATPTNSTTST